MNKQTAGLTLAILIVLLITLPNKAIGCSCLSISPCAAYGDSKAVFIGRMIGGTEKNTWEGPNGRLVELEAGDVRFEVEEAFKGVVGKEITVFIETAKGTSCAWSGYQPGERYLIFAREYQGRLVIGPCSPSKSLGPPRQRTDEDKRYDRKHGLWSAEEGLRFLRSLPANDSAGRISITARLNFEEEAPGIPFVVSGEDKTRYEATTNENGECVFDNLKPGKYSVTAEWPKDYTGGLRQPEVEVAAFSCADVLAEVFFSGVINGQVRDEYNQPAQSIRVYALSAAPKGDQSNPWSETKEDGKFEIGGLAPGRYRLYIESASQGTPNYFYPGVSDPAQAVEIVIGKGETKEDVQFKLPPTVETQTIKGKVVWPDGKAVAEANVYLRCPESLTPRESHIALPNPSATTDAIGNFTIQGLKGFSYSLKAIVHTGDPNVYNYKNHAHAPLVRVSLADEVVEVRLVLSETGYGPNCDDEKQQKNQN